MTLWSRFGLLAAAAFANAGCDWVMARDPRFIFEKKPIEEVRHMGFRRDVDDTRRGNAVFDRAAFSADGELLLTFGQGARVWDANNGRLLRTLKIGLDGNDSLVVDAAGHRVLARRADVAPNDPRAHVLGMWDLRDGRLIGTIPDDDSVQRVRPVGFRPDGTVVVLRKERVELWAADASRVLASVDAPSEHVIDSAGPASSVTYSDKRKWELSPSGDRLAFVVWRPKDPMAGPRPVLLDLKTLELTALIPPKKVVSKLWPYGFAFSPDGNTLAVGLTEGLWLHDVGGTPERDRFIAGDHKRNRYLIPMTFTPDGERLVTLGDQLMVTTYDTRSGAMVGRVDPPFSDWNGVLRVSADGALAVTYRFVADILVLIDGRTGKQRGYVCPYFCNRAHNPVEVPYAVSPDGHRIASGGRLGAGLWNADTDQLIAPLSDASLPALKPR